MTRENAEPGLHGGRIRRNVPTLHICENRSKVLRQLKNQPTSTSQTQRQPRESSHGLCRRWGMHRSPSYHLHVTWRCDIAESTGSRFSQPKRARVSYFMSRRRGQSSYNSAQYTLQCLDRGISGDTTRPPSRRCVQQINSCKFSVSRPKRA